MDIWVVDTSNRLFIRGSKTETKFSKKKIINDKTRFFVIGPFCTHHSICLKIGSDMEVLYGNDAFSMLVVSTEKRYSSFLKKVLFPRISISKLKHCKRLKFALIVT